MSTGRWSPPAGRASAGRPAATVLRQLALDMVFLSTGSWDLLRGVTTPSELEVEVKQAAMERTGTSVLVAGSSKYGTFGKYRVAALGAFGTVVTDSALAQAAAEGVRASGTELHQVDPQGDGGDGGSPAP